MTNIKVISGFKNGYLPEYRIDGNTITCKLVNGRRILQVRLTNLPEKIRLVIEADETARSFIHGQGLLVSENDNDLTIVPVVQENDKLSADIACASGEISITTRYPYGKQGLEKLIADVKDLPGSKYDPRSVDGREVPLFILGDDDPGKPVHFVIGGEDCWETAGCLTTDAMIRKGIDAADCTVYAVPLVSPFSTDFPNGSYTTPEGKGIYGAATWGDDPPPPEYRVLRDITADLIKTGRLGCLLTIHSWQAQLECSGLETIKSAGDNTLSGERITWAEEALAALIKDVPKGKAGLSEKIWHPGLARDYLLAEYNAVTFRIEITTRGQGPDGFRKTGERLLENILSFQGWD